MVGNVSEEHVCLGSPLKTKEGLGPELTSHSYEDDGWYNDGSLSGDDDGKFNILSDLEREGRRRHQEFHTMGYRDGLIAGKEASAQEGFNEGFKESIYAGYDWGLVRGVTSALACLPDELKESLVETLEKRNNFIRLYESVNSVSTSDALKLFSEELSKNSVGGSGRIEPNLLRVCPEELRQLLSECPALKIHSRIEK